MSSQLSPVVMAKQARQFLDAARREFEVTKSGVTIPGYFLAARAIELAFKSFLLLRGVRKGTSYVLAMILTEPSLRLSVLAYATWWRWNRNTRRRCVG